MSILLTTLILPAAVLLLTTQVAPAITLSFLVAGLGITLHAMLPPPVEEAR
ncbi:hypothetical protein [Dankookia rubra]|uniref:hypothetical protein n=1 Tax=Dankookia rubra TaxID=1442381 RepID=UPI0014076D34|nr:hypothetical protein [Dankookia rubra]